MPTLLITGANRGIGLELATQYSHAGWEVIACCRVPEKATELHALKQSTQNPFHIHALDVSNPNDIQQLATQLQKKPIDILINNAGVFGPSHMTLGSIDAAAWLNVLNINTVAPLLLTQALIENVKSSQLKIIVNMSSNMGSIGMTVEKGDYIYRSSKAALNMVTKVLANELREAGVKVVALHPGWVKTDMGGENAMISVMESVGGMRRVLEGVGLGESGSFIGYDGERLGW